jgi:hypothetical protein
MRTDAMKRQFAVHGKLPKDYQVGIGLTIVQTIKKLRRRWLRVISALAMMIRLQKPLSSRWELVFISPAQSMKSL